MCQRMMENFFMDEEDTEVNEYIVLKNLHLDISHFPSDVTWIPPVFSISIFMWLLISLLH